MINKKDLEALKRMSLEEQAQAEPKENKGTGCAAGFAVYFIGYIFSMVEKDCIYHFEGKTSIFDIIPPDLVTFLSIFIGIIIVIIVNKQYKEYNSIIANAKIKLTKHENERRYYLLVNSYNEKLNAFKELYDTHTKIIDYGKAYHIDQQIIVYGNANHIIIEGKDYAFDQIIGCRLIDNQTVKKGEITAVTSTNNGDMLKRAVVGDIVGGRAGAVIGGATAKKETTFTQQDDTIVHSYTVIINIRDLVKPVVTINLGQKEITAHEIEGLINAVISMNRIPTIS